MATLPQIDGGGDPDIVIYVESHAGLVPYAARSHTSVQVSIGGVAHRHVSEHDGRWVYRMS